MPSPPLTREAERLDHKREPHRNKQPYASEIEDRELERAQKEGRPVNSDGDAAAKPSDDRARR